MSKLNGWFSLIGHRNVFLYSLAKSIVITTVPVVSHTFESKVLTSGWQFGEMALKKDQSFLLLFYFSTAPGFYVK
jgi:hypothetical protein